MNNVHSIPCFSNSFSSEFDEDAAAKVKYRVSMLGMNETGKTALVSQFLTSEYMNTYDASLGEFVYRPTCLTLHFTRKITTLVEGLLYSCP